MMPFSLGHDYCKKMLELQEKLRKSEEERIQLEKRFALIERESRMKHEGSINKLQMRYIEFLEEQRVRDERNNKLLGALDRVDESLALMTAKTKTLCTLRKEYEAFLVRACTNRRQTESVTGDSGVVSQNEDRQMRKDIRNLSYVNPKSRYNNERKLHIPSISISNTGNLYNPVNNPRAVFNQFSSAHLSTKPLVHSSDLFLQNRRSQLANYGHNYEFPLSNECKSHRSADEYLTNNLDPVLKEDVRKKYLTSESTPLQFSQHFGSAANTSKVRSNVTKLLKPEEEHSGDVLGNELDKYIHKIRSLHDNNDSHSLEEIEQNTSGDLLNVTLSDDGLDHLPVEEKLKKREIPKEVDAILAIADDLVSKTVGDDTSQVSDENIEKINVNTSQQKLLDEFESSSRVALNNVTVNNSDLQPATSTPVCILDEKDKINNDVAMQEMKLNLLTENIDTIAKPMTINKSLRSTHLPENDVEIPVDQEIFVNINNPLKIVNSNKSNDEEREVNDDDKIKIVNNIETHDIKNLEIEKDCQEILVNENINSADELRSKTDVQSADNEENNCEEINQAENIIETNEIITGNELITSPIINSNNDENINIENTPTVDYDVSGVNYENSHGEQYKQDPQLYPQDQNQIYEYNNEQYNHEINQQYQYDPNLEYEQNPNEQYQYDQQNPQYIEDPNVQYHDQQYIENDNQQYEVNPNEQYNEYSENSNQQYLEEYAQDPNATYDPTVVYPYATENPNYTADNAYDESTAFISDQHHEDYQEESNHHETLPNANEQTILNYQTEDLSNNINDNQFEEHHEHEVSEKLDVTVNEQIKNSKDVIQSILDSETESTMEKNISNTESDFDFN